MKNTFTTLFLVAVTSVVTPIAFVGCATSSDRDTAHKRTAGQRIDDTVLAQRVRGALGDSAVYKFPHVNVETYKGTVQLSGFVETAEQKRKAEEIAKNVQGVYTVQNQITLKSDAERVRGNTDTSTRSTTTDPNNKSNPNGTSTTTPRTNNQ